MKKTLLSLIIVLITIAGFAQNPVAWYPMNGNANDTTGNGHNGTVNGATLAADRNSNPNSCYAFSGTAQSIAVAYDTAFNIPPSGQWTISLWVYPDTTNSKARALFVKCPPNTAWDYGMYIFNNNKIMIGYNGVHICWSKTQLQPKQWYCVTGTYNNGDWKIYINGQLDSAVINSGKYITQSTGAIGMGVKGLSLIDYFKGRLDDVAFYNVALSDSQIAALSCSTLLGNTVPKSNFSSSDTSFCGEIATCLKFRDHSTGNPTSWKWLFPGATPDSSDQQNPDSICYGTTGTYPVTLIVTNAAGSDTLTVSPMITVGATPPTPTITVIGSDTLISSQGISYQWYWNGNLIPSATDSFYIAQQGGTYAVMITDSNGCNALSNGMLITGLPALSFAKGSSVRAYPNPASEWLEVQGLKFDVGATMDVLNTLGERILSQQFDLGNIKSQTVDISSLSNGIYFLKIRTDESADINCKFIVLHK